MLFQSSEFKAFVSTQREALSWHRRYAAAWNELEPILDVGLEFTSKGQQFRVRMLHEDDNSEIDQIVNAANTLPQLVGLTEDGVKNIASQRLAIVTEAKVGENWEVASYMGAEPLTQEEEASRLRSIRKGLSMREIRTSITFTSKMSQSGKDYRGYGLNTTVKPIQFLNLFASSEGILPIAFNDNIPAFNGLPVVASETQHINDKFGLGTLLVSKLRRGSSLQRTIVEPCPAGRCAPRGDKHPMCTCAIRYFKPEDKLPPSGIIKVDVVLARHGLIRGEEN